MSFYPDYALTSSVWALPLSLATTRGITVVFFSSAYLDVSVQRVRLPLQGMSCLLHDGLPHSDICGSTLICNSPQLFAACHVLLRLREPRHPPCALPYFILSITSQFPSSLLYALLVSPSIMSMNFFSGYSILYPSLVENKGVEPLTPSLQS